MFVEYDSLLNEISRVLSNCRLAAHQARLKALSTLLQGLLLLGLGFGRVGIRKANSYVSTGS
jgi:hypothetical protein